MLGLSKAGAESRSNINIERRHSNMTTLTNYELLELYKRLTIDGLRRFALQVEEEIFMRMSY
jgi:hypothetical protein